MIGRSKSGWNVVVLGLIWQSCVAGFAGIVLGASDPGEKVTVTKGNGGSAVYKAAPKKMSGWGPNAVVTPASPLRPPDHRMIKKITANGDIFHWDYIYPTAGRECRGSEVYAEPDYYRTLVQYPASNHTVAISRRGNVDQKVDYYFDTTIFKMTRIEGPGNRQENMVYSNQNVVEYRADDSATGRYLLTRAGYDWNHNVTNWSYGYCSEPVNPWFLTWNNNYNTLETVTDPEGHLIKVEYTNALISKVREIVSESESYDTFLGYTTNGLLMTVTNANGHWVHLDRDQAGYVTNILPQAGPSIGFERDSLGHVSKVVLPGEPGDRVVGISPDEQGRPLYVTYPDGLWETNVFDAYGNLLTNVDTAGRVTSLEYAFEKVTKVTRTLEGDTPEAVVMRFDRDNQLNTLRITDPLNRPVESYQLDLADRVVSVTNLEGQVMTVNWAIDDYISSITRFDGSVVSNAYDTAGRLARQSYSGGGFEESGMDFSYYRNGLLKTASSEQGTISNAYNSVNRLVNSVFQVPGLGIQPSVSYAYYPAGQVSNVASVGGTSTYSLDNADRISGLQVSGLSQQSFQYSYNANNGLISCVSNVESGLAVSYGFDVMDRVTNIVWRDALGNVVRGFAYAYNQAGMITNKQTTANGQQTSDAYEYDSLDRLISESAQSASSEVTTAFSYDLAGNRISMVVNGTNTSYTLGQGNRLAAWGAGSSMSYDAAGSVTAIVYSASSRVDLKWNGRYQVTSLATNGAECERNGFDALGRRVWNALANSDQTWETNYFVYDGANVIADLDATGGVKRSYVWAGIDNMLSMTVFTGGVTRTYYPVKDHLGSVVAMVDSTGAIVEQYKYDAFGKTTVMNAGGTVLDQSAIGNRYCWQGREYSFKTGLYFHRARWYDAVTGRWLSNDPIGISGGLDQYVFCEDNPVNFRDPFGLCDLRKKISDADLWLRKHHPELYEGITPLFMPDTIPGAEGLFLGTWGPYTPNGKLYSIISINRWYDWTPEDLICTMAHELMHAQRGVGWYEDMHEQIRKDAADIRMEYLLEEGRTRH